jgi:acyl-CoA reductase-like NAD-dependent aldehyde dehydrogenase
MPEFSDVPFAVPSARCRAAQIDWARRPVRERLGAVRAVRHCLADRVEALTAAAHADVGRNPGELVGTDLLPAAAAMKFLEGHAARILKPARAPAPPLWLRGGRDTIHRRPFGVVGVVGTWNYPVYLNAVPIVHALVAGNGVLWKPSEFTPRTAAVLSQLFADAGLPKDLLITLPATREAGPMLAEADVDFIQFTGSDAVGRQLAKRLGERLIPSTLELSGTDACFVLADADPAFAARAVWYGTTLNAGQTCLAVRRVFVARAVYEPFVAALTELAKQGRPVKLVLPSQAEYLAEVVRGAQGQVLKSPNPLTPFPQGKGESEPKPDFSPFLSGKGAGELGGCPVPIFLLNPPPDHPVFDRPCFAPLAAVVLFDDLDEAVRRHEAGRFGLWASVFTNDPASGERLAARLTTGGVIVNDVIAPTAHPGTPFGGRKASGWGVTGGAEGLLAFTAPQVVTVRSGRFRPHIDGFVSNDPAVPAITRGMLEMTHAKGFGRRLKGLFEMVKAMARYGQTPKP